MLGATGAYLFYVQHNFPGASWRAAKTWDFDHAARFSSSYMGMSKVGHWFSGNIGYHHIHHFDVRVPFYRLPEAHAAVEAFRREPDTSWKLRDVVTALGLALYDEDNARMLSWREVRS